MTHQLGLANSFYAIRFQKFVGVIASGQAPTSGWVHSWRRGILPNNQIWFSQTPPLGPVLQMITPFVSCAIMEVDASFQEIELFHANGNPELVHISSFQNADPILAALMQRQLPPRLYLPKNSELQDSPETVLLYKTDESFVIYSANTDTAQPFSKSTAIAAKFSPSGLYYERVLGTWESPEICKCDFRWPDLVCTNPHYTATLKVRVGSEQDIAAAISDCLRESAIGAAVAGIVATVLTGGAGFSAAKAAFMPLFTACLSSKLNDVLAVDVTLDRDCR
ncbi:hypothetical protein [Sphingomonas prati]|uniref:Uncharacterized protein n=1 Tax=Sphingomonas prati TaxID=1843237 RepID=A0A7W9BUY2_9SPHN|nr:hypothetical protein [Sphingomonas prati]MBB5730597.1 hypothetical protein [Sphingomonas prati]